MKIVETSPDRLILEDRPRFLAGFVWVMSAACLLAVVTGKTDWPAETLLVIGLGFGGGWIAHRFFPYQRLIFDRRAERFTRVVARITGRTVTTLPLPEIERAAVQAQWSEGTRMERLALVAGGERLPLEFGFYGASRDGLAKDINAWLGV